MEPSLLFLDSDDLWSKTKLRKQLDFLDKYHSIYWVHCDEVWFKNDRQINPLKRHRKQGGLFIERLLERCLISPSAVLFRRDFWEQEAVGFVDRLRVAEDYEMWLRLNLRFEIGFIDRPPGHKKSGKLGAIESETLKLIGRGFLPCVDYTLHDKDCNEFKRLKPLWEKTILKKNRYTPEGSPKAQQPGSVQGISELVDPIQH